MGQIADGMQNGEMCSECGMLLVAAHGYPVLCKECWADAVEDGSSSIPQATESEVD